VSGIISNTDGPRPSVLRRRRNGSSNNRDRDPIGQESRVSVPLWYPARTRVLYPVFGIGIVASRPSTHGWAHSTLGRFFSLDVQIQNEQRVIDTGPYRVLRHPGYAGVMFGLVGLGLALQSWASLLALLLAAIAAFAYRIQTEESFLVAELGGKYLHYMARTKGLVLYVW
jgi:protein-S-isoprenylcysteine O-methyltransferase Ste14